MGSLSNIGRIFYGIAIAVLGFLTIYYKDFPYMLLPPNHVSISGLIILAYISGAMLVLAGACIVFEKNPMSVSLLLGTVLLLIFCFYYIPYQFMVSPNYMYLRDWENGEKELALSSGAFVIAGCYVEKNKKNLTSFFGKLIPFGAIFFSITIISFGILHFMYAKEASDYIPSWVPNHIFWMYFTGAALIGAAIAIILKINIRLIATLLGTMMFIWFIILHIPRVIASPVADIGDEIASAMLALGYSGITFVIAGSGKKTA
jgi:hypothetical protein